MCKSQEEEDMDCRKFSCSFLDLTITDTSIRSSNRSYPLETLARDIHRSVRSYCRCYIYVMHDKSDLFCVNETICLELSYLNTCALQCTKCNWAKRLKHAILGIVTLNDHFELLSLSNLYEHIVNRKFISVEMVFWLV